MAINARPFKRSSTITESCHNVLVLEQILPNVTQFFSIGNFGRHIPLSVHPLLPVYVQITYNIKMWMQATCILVSKEEKCSKVIPVVTEH